MNIKYYRCLGPAATPTTPQPPRIQQGHELLFLVRGNILGTCSLATWAGAERLQDILGQTWTDSFPQTSLVGEDKCIYCMLEFRVPAMFIHLPMSASHRFT